MKKKGQENRLYRTQSERNVADQKTLLGQACSREAERMGAAIGIVSKVVPKFEAGVDMKAAGVLLAIPALMMNGLLSHIDKHLIQLKGFYSIRSILLVLGFLALLRIKSIEQVRHWDPGQSRYKMKPIVLCLK